MTIRETENCFLEQFAKLEDEFDKYTWMMFLAEKLPKPRDGLCREENLLKDCRSRVWFRLRLEEEKVRLEADSDTLIVKGILFMLTELFDGRTAEEILDSKILLFEKLDVESVLNGERRAGMTSLVERIRDFARKNRSEG